MRDGETSASSRRVPLDLDDGAGAAYTGTAPTGPEVLLSIQGAAFQTASGTVVKLRNGDFYYEATESEVRGRGMRLLRLAKSGMGTAIFEWYCGDRHASDPSDEARRAPIMLELAGSPVTGIVLSGSEVEVSVNGSAFATGTGIAAEIGFGAYYYQPSVAEYQRGALLIYANDAAADSDRHEVEIGAAISPTPTGTTAEDIRARIATVIAGLSPTRLSRDKFRESRYESGDAFIADCETQAASAFRRFAVVCTGSDEPPEASSIYDEERRSTFIVTVAYPKDARSGSKQSVDRYAAIEEDLRLIDRAIGVTGAANFTSPYPDATWVGGGADRESGDSCDYLVYSLTMLYVTTWSTP